MNSLYDRDIQHIFVHEGKLHTVYYVPVEEGIFTKEDLEYMLGMLDEEDRE